MGPALKYFHYKNVHEILNYLYNVYIPRKISERTFGNELVASDGENAVVASGCQNEDVAFVINSSTTSLSGRPLKRSRIGLL